MYHLSDKELDRLSRDASDQFDVPQKASGWEVLEEKLNKEIPTTEARKKRRFLFLLFLFLFTGGAGITGVLLMKTPETVAINKMDQPSRVLNEAGSNEDEQSIDNARLGSPIKPVEPFQKDDISSAGETTENNENKPSLFNDKKTHEPVHKGKHPDDTGRNGNKKFTSGNRIQKTNKNTPTDDYKPNPPVKNTSGNITTDIEAANRKTSEELPNSVGETLPEDSGNISDANTKKDNHQGISTDSLSDNDSKNTISDSVTNTIVEEVSPKPAKSDFKKKPVHHEKGFQIGITGAPDKSQVGSNKSKETGFNFGATISYRFSNRWSVNSGIIYMRKIYSATGKDYKPPKDYWTYGVELGVVNGDCYMFDFPINVRYDLIRNRKTKLFVSSGISGYLMRKETYDYHYTYNGVYASRERTYKTNKAQLFSVINMSAGVEHSLGKKLSLQLEPYLKIPSKGVGFGSVKLNSYGAYLSVKYKLNP